MPGFLLSLLGGRLWIGIGALAALLFLVAPPWLEARKLRGELAVELERSQRLTVELGRAVDEARVARQQLAETSTALGRLQSRYGAAQKALEDAAALERRLRRGKAPPRRPAPLTRSERARDAVERLRAPDGDDATSAGASGPGRADGS